MPVKLVKGDGGYYAEDDAGKRYSHKPMSRAAALAQVGAINSNIETEKKDMVSSTPTGINSHGPGGLFSSFGLGGGVGKPKKKKKEADSPLFDIVGLKQVTLKRDMDPNVGGGTDRDKMDAADFAGKNRSYPIKKPGDVSDAATSIGRAGSDNYSAAQLKANIIKIAHRKGPAFVSALPESWKPAKKEWGRKVTTKELKPGDFSVFKDKAGEWRWVLLSSNGFQDRDREIVSTKALRDDVERRDKATPGNYGPLRWWHLDAETLKSAGIDASGGLDIGTCDLRFVHSHTLVESGTFKSAHIGECVAKAAPTLKASIGFNHPGDEPDEDGVYHTIDIFERSLLPKGRAANTATRLFVKEA